MLKKMLRSSEASLRRAPLDWLSDAVNCHQMLATPKFMKGREEQLAAHPGWRLNFCYVLLLFCAPFFSRTANQKLEGISADYLASPGCRLDLPNESCLARGVLSPRQPDTPPADVSACTHTTCIPVTLSVSRLTS